MSSLHHYMDIHNVHHLCQCKHSIHLSEQQILHIPSHFYRQSFFPVKWVFSCSNNFFQLFIFSFLFLIANILKIKSKPFVKNVLKRMMHAMSFFTCTVLCVLLGLLLHAWNVLLLQMCMECSFSEFSMLQAARNHMHGTFTL